MKINKDKALEILHSVVDGEATPAETYAFFRYMETDPEVKRQYESMLLLKKLIKTYYKRKKAPESLRKNLLENINQNLSLYTDLPSVNDDKPVQDSKTVHRKNKSNGISLTFRYISAAAAILFFSILTIEMLEKSTTRTQYDTASIDSFVYEYFTRHKGRHIKPTFQTASLENAENFLTENHAVDIDIPKLRNARFQGIVISETQAGSKIPLFEYFQPEADQYIYIFSFHIPTIEKENYFLRDSLAIEACITKTDFYIKDVQGLHIISWRWGDNWYSAISNHNGYELASIIEPLQYDLK